MDIAASTALIGLQQAQTSLNLTAQRIANPSNTPDSVTLSDEAVSLIQARNDFHLNLNVLKIADDLRKSAISLAR